MADERLTCGEVIAIIGGFFGVIVLTNETLFSKKGDPEVTRENNDLK